MSTKTPKPDRIDYTFNSFEELCTKTFETRETNKTNPPSKEAIEEMKSVIRKRISTIQRKINCISLLKVVHKTRALFQDQLEDHFEIFQAIKVSINIFNDISSC